MAKATGNFDSATALARGVWTRFINTPAKLGDIAKDCDVSLATVNRILATDPRQLREATGKKAAVVKTTTVAAVRQRRAA